jgi:F-type H+-transporting ATPase subunit gamma
MAGSKEIRTKIKSVENTRKITRAMEMVAAAKMRKAQERMHAARPYAEKIRAVAAHLSRANPEYKHPFLVKREGIKNVGLIVVTSDKGLCGGLNTNVLRLAINRMKSWESEGKGLLVCPIGNKGLGFMNRVGAKVKSHLTGLGDTPHIETLIGAVKVMLDACRRDRRDTHQLQPFRQHDETGTVCRTIAATNRRADGNRGRKLGLYLRAGCQTGD